MFRRFLALVCACIGLCVPAVAQSVPAGYVLVSQSRLLDAAGNPANAQVCAQPVSLLGKPVSLRVGGTAGGVVIQSPVCTNAVSGVWSMALPDMFRAQPTVSGLNITATDSVSGKDLIGPGYNFVQPGSDPTSKWCSGGACNFDLLPPMSKPTIATYVQGPIGPQGPQGVQGVPGSAQSLSTVAGSAVAIMSGSVYVYHGESNCLGYGAGLAYGQILDRDSPYFHGRTTYANFCTNGYTLAQVQSEYAAKVKPYCVAAASSGVPANFIFSGGSNSIKGNVAASDALATSKAMAQQALADGCQVYGTTVTGAEKGYYNAAQETQRKLYNDGMRALNSSTSGKVLTGLIDQDRLFPDASANLFASDFLHWNTAAAYAMAAYAQTVFLGGNPLPGDTPRGRYQRFGAITTGVIYPNLDEDVVRCKAGAVAVNFAQIAVDGKLITVLNDGGACYPFQGDGTITVGGATYAGGQSAGPALTYLGDAATYQYDDAAQNWVLLAGPVRGNVHHVRTLTSSGEHRSLATDDIVDTAGNEYDLTAGGVGGIPLSIGQRIVVVNSGSAASLVTGFPGPAVSLAAGGTLTVDYVSSAAGLQHYTAQ